MPTTDEQQQKSVPDQAKEEYDRRMANADDMAKAWVADGSASHELAMTTAAHMTAQATLALAAATRLLAAEQARANDLAEATAQELLTTAGDVLAAQRQVVAAGQARCEYVARASGAQCVKKGDGHRVHKGVTEDGNVLTWSYGENGEQVKAS